MKKIIHIILYKLLAFLKFDRNYSLSKIFKDFGSFLVYSAFAVGAFLFTKSIIGFLLVKMKIGIFLLHEFFSIVLFIFFIAVNIGNVIVSYSTLYKSSEVSYLMTKPVNVSGLFVIKFLDNYFYSSGTLLMVLTSVLAGYAVYFQIDLFQLLLIITFNFIPFMFIAASLGAIILLVIMKVASRYGLRKVIMSLIAVYLTSVLLFFNLNSPMNLVKEVMQYYPNVDRYFGDFIPTFVKFLPNNWVTESLFWTVQNRFDLSYQYIILQCCVSLLFFGIAVLLGKKWYYQTWLISPRKRIRNEKAASKNFVSFNNGAQVSSPKEVILKKDLFLFIREPSQVIHASILLFLILLFVASVSSVNLMGAFNVDLQTILYLVVYLFNVLLISALSLRFVFPLLSLEGLSFWKIKTSPVSIKKYLRIRILYPFFIIFIIGQALSFFLNFYFTVELIFTSGITTAFITLAVVMFNFGMGGIFVKYNEKSPIRIASSQGASLSFLLSLIYMVFLVIVMFIPINKYFSNYYRHTYFGPADVLIPVLIIGFVSIFIAVTFYMFALKSLKKDY